MSIDNGMKNATFDRPSTISLLLPLGKALLPWDRSSPQLPIFRFFRVEQEVFV